MVARPPVRIVVGPMALDDLPEVHRIERLSFSVPWPDDAYRSELRANRLASYLVVRAGDLIVAYGGIWLMVDEAHATGTFGPNGAGQGRFQGGRNTEVVSIC